jgi:hypothetical protein
VGDKIEADGYRVTVQKMRRRKILSVIFEDVNPESREMGMRGEEDNGDFIIVEEGA